MLQHLTAQVFISFCKPGTVVLICSDVVAQEPNRGKSATPYGVFTSHGDVCGGRESIGLISYFTFSQTSLELEHSCTPKNQAVQSSCHNTLRWIKIFNRDRTFLILCSFQRILHLKLETWSVTGQILKFALIS